MSGGITATTVMAGAAVVGAGASIMQGQEASKQADRQYEAQQAAFNNEIEAALINSEWQLTDNATQYNIDNTQRDSIYSSSIDTLWGRANTELDRMTGRASIDALDTMLASEVDMEAAISSYRTSAQSLLADALVDMEYTMAMSAGAQDYNSQKAILDAIEFAGIAQATVQLLDQDINTIKEQITRVKEEADIQTVEAIGKMVASQAASLTAGNSRARSIMTTMNRADMLKQAKVDEQTTALEKAYGTQHRTAQNANTQITTAYNEAIIQNNRIRQETLSNLTRTIETTGINSEEMLQNATSTIAQITNTLSANLSSIENSLNLETTNIGQVAGIEADSLTAQYAAERTAATDNYTYSQIQNFRNREQSYQTAFEQYTGAERDNAFVEYAQFTNTPEYRQYTDWAETNGHEYGIPNIDTSTFGADAQVAANTVTNGTMGDTSENIEANYGHVTNQYGQTNYQLLTGDETYESYENRYYTTT